MRLAQPLDYEYRGTCLRELADRLGPIEAAIRRRAWRLHLERWEADLGI